MGLSGVVFGLIVVDNAVSRAAQRSIFGFFTVPAKLYPWALLLFWQLLMPGASFLGHLCGVAVRRQPRPCRNTLSGGEAMALVPRIPGERNWKNHMRRSTGAWNL